jgi:hypothetical protein
MTEEQNYLLTVYMKARCVAFEKGLTEKECETLEDMFEIVFPCDYKAFIQTELPVSQDFTKWRLALSSAEAKKKIQEQFEFVQDGILFDIENNGYWERSWGEKPQNLNEQFEIAKRFLKTYPKLIPIYSHRYIPEKPSDAGNPILSVVQTDIICYGADLAHYFSNEFSFILKENLFPPVNKIKPIEFWGHFISDE